MMLMGKAKGQRSIILRLLPESMRAKMDGKAITFKLSTTRMHDEKLYHRLVYRLRCLRCCAHYDLFIFSIMKYLIFTNIISGQKLPVFFPEHVTHSEVRLDGYVATSGGFVDLQKFEAGGSSQSLGLRNLGEEDTILIQLMMSGMFESTWALHQDPEANKKELHLFCASCLHLRAAHRFGHVDQICRCAVSGCGCASLAMPKKVGEKC